MEMWEYCFIRLVLKTIQVDYYTPSGTKREVHKLDTKEQKAEFKVWQSNLPRDYYFSGNYPENLFLRDKQVTLLLASGWELFLVDQSQYVYKRQYQNE